MGSNFDTMSRETTSHPAALKALPIDFVPQNSSSSLGMFNNYHQHNKASSSFACSDQSFFNREQKRMTSQASMWKLGKVRSNAKGGKFLCLEPLLGQSEASLEIPREPRAFSEGHPSVSFATDERARLFWEQAETDLVEQLAAASKRVFDAKLTPKAVRQRLLPSVRQSRGGDWMLKAKLPAHARFWNAGGTFADRPAELAHCAARVRLSDLRREPAGEPVSNQPHGRSRASSSCRRPTSSRQAPCFSALASTAASTGLSCSRRSRMWVAILIFFTEQKKAAASEEATAGTLEKVAPNADL